MKSLFCFLLTLLMGFTTQAGFNSSDENDQFSRNPGLFLPPPNVEDTSLTQPIWYPLETYWEKGKSDFTQFILEGQIVFVDEIPPGKVNIEIQLFSHNGKNLDLQLHCGDTNLISWPMGLLNEPNQQSLRWEEVTIEYSGYNGVNGDLGREAIRVIGRINKPLIIEVYGYQSDTVTVTYNWGNGVGEFCDASLKICNKGLGCKAVVDGYGSCHSKYWCTQKTADVDCKGLFHQNVTGRWGCEEYTCHWRPLTTAVPPEDPLYCDLDLVYLIDTSGSLGETWGDIKSQIKNYHIFNVGTDQFNAGVVAFDNTGAYNAWGMKRINDQSNPPGADSSRAEFISLMSSGDNGLSQTFTGPAAKLDEGLSLTQTLLLNETVHPKKAAYIIVGSGFCPDGDCPHIVTAANNLKQNNVFIIGIGLDLEPAEISLFQNEIASAGAFLNLHQPSIEVREALTHTACNWMPTALLEVNYETWKTTIVESTVPRHYTLTSELPPNAECVYVLFPNNYLAQFTLPTLASNRVKEKIKFVPNNWVGLAVLKFILTDTTDMNNPVVVATQYLQYNNEVSFDMNGQFPSSDEPNAVSFVVDEEPYQVQWYSNGELLQNMLFYETLEGMMRVSFNLISANANLPLEKVPITVSFFVERKLPSGRYVREDKWIGEKTSQAWYTYLNYNGPLTFPVGFRFFVPHPEIEDDDYRAMIGDQEVEYAIRAYIRAFGVEVVKHSPTVSHPEVIFQN